MASWFTADSNIAESVRPSVYFDSHMMATHESDGVLVSASGVNAPHEQANGYAIQMIPKSLPVDFYTDFLSNSAKERRPSPSMFPMSHSD